MCVCVCVNFRGLSLSLKVKPNQRVHQSKTCLSLSLETTKEVLIKLMTFDSVEFLSLPSDNSICMLSIVTALRQTCFSLNVNRPFKHVCLNVNRLSIFIVAIKK